MKKLLVLLIVALILAFTIPALAQGGDDGGGFTLPPTAADGVATIAVFLAGLAGLLATAITDVVKRFPFITPAEKDKISGPLANLVAALVSIASGYIIGWLGQAAGLLDQSGVWQVILFSWPAAKGWFEASQFRRGIAKT